jgi:serine protease AprX
VPSGLDGSGIVVGVVDTGFYPHPYYSDRGLAFHPRPTASAPAPDVDDHGHGTAISFNVFAVAPAVTLLGFKQTNPPQDALEDAADASVDIISCSWGWDYEQVFPILQATLLDIIVEGRIVLFAAGNGHYAWPGSQPEVLSVGGVYWNAQDVLEASNYASGYMSSLYPGRRVPDFCGLCGMQPKAIYILMPTQPGNLMDRDNAGASHPDHDETGPSDGWVGASGTSSATPQIAGVIALMLQQARALGRPLSPGRVKQILEQTAVPITQGRNSMGIPATGQPNAATGWGLVDAGQAVAAV